MKRNCSYCSSEDLLRLRDAHQRTPVPTISHYYTVFILSERALRPTARDVRRRLNVLEYRKLKSANPARIPTISADMAQDLQWGT